MQCESTRGTAGAMGGGSADEPLPGEIQDAVAAAIEDGATMDEIVERVRALGGDRSPSAEDRWAARMDGLICLQREAVRFAEEWERTRDPGAEGRSALVAIETLRTLALSTLADLSQRAEPVPTEDLARLALALHRIENADRLRIEREQTMADAAAAHDGAAARAASMTHAERVETVRRAMEGHLFPGVHRPAAGGIRVGRRLCRGLSTSPRRTRRPSRLPPTGRRMRTRVGCASRVHARKQTMHGTRTGRGMPS